MKRQSSTVAHLKHSRGQFYTTRYSEIMKGLVLPQGIHVIEPFAGNRDLVPFIRDQVCAASYMLYDLYPVNGTDDTMDTVHVRDTLLNPPDYSDMYVITNPPYLARNKSVDKTVFDMYGLNDLFKCFMRSLIRSKCLGGIVIVPVNFFSSVRALDVDLRREFLNRFRVERVNVFEYQVFEDTSAAVCAFVFFGGLTQCPIPFTVYESPTSFEACSIDLTYTSPSLCVPEFEFSASKSTHRVERLITELRSAFGSQDSTAPEGRAPLRLSLSHDVCITRLVVDCVDGKKKYSICMHVVDDIEPYRDTTPRSSNRSHVALVITPPLSLQEQHKLCTEFNESLLRIRTSTCSLCLPSFREFARKRIPFEYVYSLVRYILTTKGTGS